MKDIRGGVIYTDFHFLFKLDEVVLFLNEGGGLSIFKREPQISSI